MRANEVVASKYVVGNGQEYQELIALGDGRYIVARNGQIDDARRKIGREEAAAWWDGASRQMGPRPGGVR